MRHIAPILALALMSVPVPSRIDAQQNAADAARARVGRVTTVSQGQVSISGDVARQAGRPLADTTVQARNLMTGRIGGSAVTAHDGQVSIAGLEPGNYVLEVVDGGQVVGTSPRISVPADATASTMGTLTSGSGARSTVMPTAPKGAIAAGVAGVVIAADDQTVSPSR